MTFEEFFRKKKIDLVALQSAQPGLFSEFKEHYEAMGEKSFDHTKKYWFNKLRLQYHLAPEVKEEKVVIENRLAEQTIAESLTEPVASNAGFKPRFRAGATSAKPADTSDKKELPIKESATVTPDVNDSAVNHDQQPDFQKEKEAMQEVADQMPRTTDAEPAETRASATSKPGFKPRFNMNMAQGAAPQSKEFEQEKPEGEVGADEKSSEQPATPKPAGFKPRFNAAKMAAKKDEVITDESPATEAQPVENINPDLKTQEEPAAPKPAGFKPRFNAAKMAAKKEERAAATQPAENATPIEQKAEEPKTEEQDAKPAAESRPKLGFKPRFNPPNTKPQPPKTEE